MTDEPIAAGTRFMRIEVRCPMCELVDRQLFVELQGAAETSCGFCGADIDLTTDEWKARLAASALTPVRSTNLDPGSQG